MPNTRTALITGSTTGIGLAIAERLAAEGCNIVLNGLATADEMAPAIEKLKSLSGADAIFDPADVGNVDDIERMFGATHERFGGVDFLINNAVTRVFGMIEETNPADWRRAMAVNLDSAFHALRLALPGMKARNFGRIVNMSSIYGLKGGKNRASYIVAKTGLIGLTRAVAMECIDFDITCNAVCPGTVNTSLGAAVIKREMQENGVTQTEAEKRFLAGKQPTGEFITSESIADLVAFLCLSKTTSINGATLPIDMAWSAS